MKCLQTTQLTQAFPCLCPIAYSSISAYRASINLTLIACVVQLDTPWLAHVSVATTTALTHPRCSHLPASFASMPQTAGHPCQLGQAQSLHPHPPTYLWPTLRGPARTPAAPAHSGHDVRTVQCLSCTVQCMSCTVHELHSGDDCVARSIQGGWLRTGFYSLWCSCFRRGSVAVYQGIMVAAQQGIMVAVQQGIMVAV